MFSESTEKYPKYWNVAIYWKFHLDTVTNARTIRNARAYMWFKVRSNAWFAARNTNLNKVHVGLKGAKLEKKKTMN